MELAEDATAMGNPNAASDGMSAAGTALRVGAGRQGQRGDQCDSRSTDETRRRALLDEVAGIRERADSLLEQCLEAFGLRLSG